MMYFIQLIVLIFAFSPGILASPKDVLTFDGGAQIITSGTSCAPNKWGKNVVNSCLCCIVKTTPQGSIGVTLERNILASCKKYCSNETLKLISKKLTVNQEDFKGIIQEIMKSNSVLHYIDMSGEYLGKNGDLDEETASILLKKAVDLGYIKGTDFKAKKLGGGGAQTLQLFLITEGEKPKYILKEMKNAFSEVKNLQIIKQSRLKAFILNPNKTVKRIPALAIDEQNFTYSDKGVQHHLSLLDIAGGNAISDIIFDWTKHPENTENATRAKRALYRVGQNLGLIHVTFMTPKGSILGKTYVHRDLHPYNLFYDDLNDRIVFIDNESFTISILKPQDASLDIMKFYGRLVAARHKKRHTYIQKGTSENDFYNIIVKPFIIGYVDAYGNQKEAALQMLYKLMSGQNALKTYLDNKKTELNPIDLYRNQQVYLKPLFVEIAKERGLNLNASAKTSILGKLLK